MLFTEIKARLTKLDTACICDVNKKIRVMDPAIRPVRHDLKLIGRAHTVRCCDDFLTVIKALKDATAGEVLVVDGQGGQRALAGELFTTEAYRKELAGLVVDGSVRDVKTIMKLSMPVYSRYIFPVSGTASKIFETQIPVSCGGVTIHPGDILFGDNDGIIVASDSEIIDLIPFAEQIQQKEEIVLSKLKNGESLLDYLNFEDHLANVEVRKESNLKFKI